MPKDVIIFGAGIIGQRALVVYEKRVAYFMDNSEKLQGTMVGGICVKSVEEGIRDAGDCRIVIASIQQASMAKQLDGLGVTDYISFLDDIDEIYYMQASRYINELLENKKPRESVKRVGKVTFLSYGFSAEKEKKSGGGPLGAICMQKKCLGERVRELAIEYPYYVETDEIPAAVNKFPYMTGAIEAVQKMCGGDKDTIYIANDIFSAFGLYVLGKHYCLIFHAQGDVVKEMTLWGHNLSENIKTMIYRIEELAVANAYKVLFPSKGAETYFRKSFEQEIKFSSGNPLYNTVTDFPVPCEVEGVATDNDCITFLSIGQMTRLKGMDKIPDFIEQYLQYTDKRVRWIVVANGVLKEEVREQIEAIRERTNRLEYINIDYVVSHAQIFYLMNLCNAYIMLHRVSIFDFSTLEAMYCKRPVILSDIPGNDEYNQEQNIMLVDDDTDMKVVVEYVAAGEEKGRKNREVYEKYFAKESFVERYVTLLDEFVKFVEE